MLVIPLAADGSRHLMDREALAQWTTLAEITIRRHCQPIERDKRTGTLLYDAEACRDQLAEVRRLPKTCSDGRRRTKRT